METYDDPWLQYIIIRLRKSESLSPRELRSNMMFIRVVILDNPYSNSDFSDMVSRFFESHKSPILRRLLQNPADYVVVYDLYRKLDKRTFLPSPEPYRYAGLCVCVWLCVCAAFSAVGIPVASIRTIGNVHIVLLSTYILTKTCINLRRGDTTIRI